VVTTACLAQRPAADAWIKPPVTAERLQQRTFDSPAAKAKVSFLIYTPSDYDSVTNARFPVLYWLHGVGGGQQGVADMVRRFDDAIRAGKTPPMLVVFVNGLAESMWCDSKDGKAPVETVFIQELIPHVDANFRTLATRAGRLIEGFSMGGFGAARLGFKYPETFGAISMLAGALHTEATLQQRRSSIFKNVFGGDVEYFKAQSPWTIAEQSAAAKATLKIRQVVGDRDQTLAYNRNFDAHLTKLGIVRPLTVRPGVGHNPGQIYEALGEENWKFYREAFAPASGKTAAAPAEQSVMPGVNAPYFAPDLKVATFIEKFETESREIFTHRERILSALGLQPGMAVADIGAGTGLFTLPMAEKVGAQGKVFAVDIVPKFLAHIRSRADAAKLANIETVLCTDRDVKLPPGSIDRAFICDTYHHFEYPRATLATLHAALRDGGELVLIDFKRIPGVSSDFVLGHVRAGQEVFTREIEPAGFRLVGAERLLKENYFLRFAKVETGQQAFRRTRVIGYSQVGQPRGGWFVAGGIVESLVGDDRWELLWHGGAGVDRWRDPDYAGWSRPLVSACPGDTPVDRVLLSVSGPYGSDEKAWAEAIEATIVTIKKKIPTARQIILQAVVGGPGGKPCPAPAGGHKARLGGKGGGDVRASAQHPHIVNAIRAVVKKHAGGAMEIVAGFEPQVRACEDYADALGHLTPAAAAAVGRTIGEHYARLDGRFLSAKP
jgi:enterochelin esterase-like enzyme/ubiquinone/menaquinone biosynthesis C-methylase UbiE